jgi:FkbH-like protein
MSEPTSYVHDFKFALKGGDGPGAFRILRDAIGRDDPFVRQAQAAKLFRSIPATALALRPLKVALLAGSTVDHFADILRFWLATAGFAADIFIAPFDMIVQTVLDYSSDLYTFKPDVAWLFTTHRDVRLEIAAGAGSGSVEQAVAAAVGRQVSLWEALLGRLNCIVVQNNADSPADDPFGNLAGVAVWGARNALRRYNVELGAAMLPGVVIYDLDHAASLYGKRQWFDSRYWFHSKHAFAFDAIGLVASSSAQLIAAAKGMARKCLVLDLDNTLWGGVIGDDGIDGIMLGQKADGEAFSAFQAYAHALKERGIILAVCSKNDETNAKEPFERHPDMRLRLSDIAVFRANWNNKVDNLRDIAATLNIGLDSLVFADDNPAEREIVRRFLPVVAVPDLPEDPAGFVSALADGRYFETTSFSDEDRERSRYYQENVKRAELQLTFKDTADYLLSLQMTAEVGGPDSFHLPRMAQLINKSNQFQLTGTRYSDAEMLALAARDDHAIRYFKLSDRFGDNGLIAVIVLKIDATELHVDTWVMSCRVLGRSMEEFICNEMLSVAQHHNCRVVVGRYRASAKNKLVSGLYDRLGFEKISDDDGGTAWRRPVHEPLRQLTSYITGQAAMAAE